MASGTAWAIHKCTDGVLAQVYAMAPASGTFVEVWGDFYLLDPIAPKDRTAGRLRAGFRFCQKAILLGLLGQEEAAQTLQARHDLRYSPDRDRVGMVLETYQAQAVPWIDELARSRPRRHRRLLYWIHGGTGPRALRDVCPRPAEKLVEPPGYDPGE
jgi:hypothetical protein